MQTIFEDCMYDDPQEVFNHFDCVGDGKIDVSQVGDVFRVLGRNPLDSQVKDLLCKFKIGKRIDFQTFCTFYQLLPKTDNRYTAEDIIEVFHSIDKDCSGSLRSSEMKHLLKTYGEILADEELHEIFKDFENGRGLVDYTKEMSSTRARFLHVKCRNSVYPRTEGAVERLPVPDDKVRWEIKWEEYQPIGFTASFIKNQVWADPDIGDPNFTPKWNSLDENINRKSYDGVYEVHNSYPLNIFGRTGVHGRGVLGRWGPNHAADPIVTRWKRDNSNKIVTNDISCKPILQFVAIKRRDSGEWAIPGGMVDPGELVSSTLKREFLEEALNILEKNEAEKATMSEKLNEFFGKGKEIYKGYVDDPRNTDNSWMETVAMHFHDESGDTVGALNFCAGDDAVGVQWLDLNKTLLLYASHSSLIEKVASEMKCDW